MLPKQSKKHNPTRPLTKKEIESSSECPTPLPVIPENVPQELKELKQWVCWRYDRRNDKWTKIPINPKTGRRASSTDPGSWGTFDKAHQYYQTHRTAKAKSRIDGIGFVFSPDDSYCGVDLDECRAPESERINECELEHINLIESYTEISPSGTGVKIFAQARLPPGGNRKGNVEMYDRSRFFVVTGHLFENFNTIRVAQEEIDELHSSLFSSSSSPANDRQQRTMNLDEPTDDEIVQSIKEGKYEEGFLRLWSGDARGYQSHSEADFALCRMLADLVSNDRDRINSLFRRSGLYRDKWNREDYREETIVRAIDVNARPRGNGKQEKKSQATLLVELAQKVELFHAPGESNSEGFASINRDSHCETWPIKSSRFRGWLGQQFYDRYAKAPGSQSLQDAINVLAGQAQYGGDEHEIAVRLAEHEGSIWLDLANPEWQSIRITPEGWTVESESPIRFIRRPGMLPLPTPVPGGSIDQLRNLVNLPDDDDWVLFVSWLVAALRPGRPFPVLAVNGEQGSAKSTLCRIARTLIDPNQAPLRRPARNDQDLMIAATNSWIIGFDNLSGIRSSLSDSLCSLSTGGVGLGTRQLYTDAEEKLFSAHRPVILNGIEDIAGRPDLLDRSITITLPTISDEDRRDEDQIWSDFDQIRGENLGALLDAASLGLSNLETVELTSKPRMADFARWGAACEPAFGWTSGTFIRAYQHNRSTANHDAIESMPFAGYLSSILVEGVWKGTAAELLAAINKEADENAQRLSTWPTTPRKLSGDLRRIAPNLRMSGLDVTFTAQATRRGKLIVLEEV